MGMGDRMGSGETPVKSQIFKHLYINLLEQCNLRCQMCYTKKTNAILTQSQIVDFIDAYQKQCQLDSVTFCGGEVCTLPYFTSLVNTVTSRGIFIQIITNGTIDKLGEFEHPNMVNLIVSIDGLPPYHDANRGKGNFTKSMDFLKKAHSMGFHTEIFSIVTRQNYKTIDQFENYLSTYLGKSISVTYHPRKPRAYLLHHPVSNIVGSVDGFDFLTPGEMIHLMNTKKTFPPKELGCYQISLMSNGMVYGCCEGTVPIGTIRDKVDVLIERLNNRLQKCALCSYPEFMCGLKDIELV
jgi:sulfatase maturation enzyme AslB (radical SAM superfamily)